MKPHLSPTQLDMLSRCQMQYEFRYLQGLKIPPAVSMVIGTATHCAVEKNLGAKIATGALLPEEEVVSAAVDALKTTWLAEDPALSADEKTEGVETVKGAAIDTAAALSKLHHVKVAPAITPIHLEREVRVELKGFPYDMKGFIDIQEPTQIRDTKTASKSPSGEEAEQSTQLTFYAMAAHVIDKKAPEKVILDYLVKTKEPKYVSLESTRDMADYERLLRRVERAAKLIEAGNFMPAAPGAWNCSERWCGYWHRCPFGSKKRVQG